MLKKFLTLCAFLSAAAASHASVTITAQALTPNLIESSGSTALAVGDLVRIGYFTGSANPATDNSFSDLSASFKAIGEGNSDGDTLSEFSGGNPVAGDSIIINNAEGAGTFSGNFDTVSSTYYGANPGAGNVQLYMWVFNASNLGSATQWGIFTDSAWDFPPDQTSVNLTLSSANVNVVRGSASGSDFYLANIPSSVPEPTTLAALGSLIVLGSAALRRRARA